MSQPGVLKTLSSTMKDFANPFMRLVANSTIEDDNHHVPFYQCEEIKEATYQSQYGCDCVFKALSQRVEHKSPVVRMKALLIIRSLMLEGPASFSNKMGSLSGQMMKMAQSEALRDTVEARIKELAFAIQQAITGDTRALVNSTNSQYATGARDQGHHSYKTEFQLQQEREHKAFKKKKEEEKKSSSIVVNEKLYDSFSPSLQPAKLVEAAVTTPKKKFAKEELESFVSAAFATDRVVEVCAALDAALKDRRYGLQTRYKALVLVDALVDVGAQDEEIIHYFQQHPSGIQRYLSIDSTDNPAKAQLAQELARTVAAKLQNSPAPVRQVASVPVPVASVPLPPSSQPIGSQMKNGSASLDELFFSNMHLKQPEKQATFSDWTSTPPMPPVPNNSLIFSGSGNTTPMGFGGSFGGPACPNNSLATPPTAPVDITAQLAEMQRNMQLMMQMATTAASASHSASESHRSSRANSTNTSPAVGHQQVLTSSAPSEMQLPPPHALPQTAQPPSPGPMPQSRVESADVKTAPASGQIQQPPLTAQSSAPPPSNAVPSAPPPAKADPSWEMMQQLQQQMLATQQMLAQQQQLFAALQAQMQQKQQQ